MIIVLTDDTQADHAVRRTVSLVVVEDDPSLLDSLGQATQQFHDRWDVHLEHDAVAARTRFDAGAPVDVLLVDLDLETGSAADLLERVRDQSPHTVRIVMSRRSDRASVLHLIASAHRYLPMPVDIDLLAAIVEHVRCSTGDQLHDPVRSLIASVDRLPRLPELFQRLTAMIAGGDWTIDAVAAELAQDVALTTEVLKLVNSAFYGVHREVTSVERAIALLGIDMIRSAVLGNEMFRPTDTLEMWLDLERLDNRSKSVAFGTRALAVRDRAPNAVVASAYLTGMVSEVGMLVMARVPGIVPSIAQPVNDKVFLGAERAIFGGDRFEIGRILLDIWGFSPSIIEALGRLSRPDEGGLGGLAWYLVAARRLVVDDGFDPVELAAAPGDGNLAVDEALDRLRAELATAAATA